MQKRAFLFLFCCGLFFSGKPVLKPGDKIDELDGVAVFYNGKNFKNTMGRHLSSDGYNFGLKYQCVEFVKRYYYYHFDHKMPDPSGHAKDFFDEKLGDIGFNEKRGLTQYRNVRYSIPQKGDLLIYGAHEGNPFGHVAIISKIDKDKIEIIQQNWGTQTRKSIPLVLYENIVTVADYYIKGWLRKE